MVTLGLVRLSWGSRKQKPVFTLKTLELSSHPPKNILQHQVTIMFKINMLSYVIPQHVGVVFVFPPQNSYDIMGSNREKLPRKTMAEASGPLELVFERPSIQAAVALFAPAIFVWQKKWLELISWDFFLFLAFWTCVYIGFTCWMCIYLNCCCFKTTGRSNWEKWHAQSFFRPLKSRTSPWRRMDKRWAAFVFKSFSMASEQFSVQLSAVEESFCNTRQTSNFCFVVVVVVVVFFLRWIYQIHVFKSKNRCKWYHNWRRFKSQAISGGLPNQSDTGYLWPTDQGSWWCISPGLISKCTARAPNDLCSR